MTTPLDGLIERVERCTGPDREIDMLLADYFGLVVEAFADVGLRFDPNAVDVGAPFFTDPGMCAGMGFSWSAPTITASIDAVLDLVERKLPGHRWGVASAAIKDGTYPDGKPRYAEGFKAHVTKVSALRPMPAVGQGRTAALAIILAFLRALQSIKTSETPDK